MPVTQRPLLRALLVSLLTATAGCGAPGAAVPSVIPPTPTDVSTAASPPERSPSPSAPSAPSSVAPTSSSLPSPTVHPATTALAGRSWATATLTEVSSGRPFTIASLAGRTVFVEAMAIWCTKCREQQIRFKEALGRIDPALVAYVVLTVDPGETAAELARYKRDRGFVGDYAVAGKAVSSALADEFGATVLNPPTVPLILITRAGEIRFEAGGESVDEIVRLAGG